MIGLNAGSWPPRGLSEDPLLPDHTIRQDELDPLPVSKADRRDFETILACAAAEVADFLRLHGLSEERIEELLQ